MSATSASKRSSTALIKEISNLSEDELESKAFHVKRLLEGFEFFQQLAPTVRERLPSVVKIVSDRKKGEVVFEEGEPPDRCYILLSGSVLVYKKELERDAEPEETVEEQSSPQAKFVEKSDSEASTRCPSPRLSVVSLGDKSSSVCVGDRSQRRLSNVSSLVSSIGNTGALAMREQPNPWGRCLATLQAGALFGELALLEDKLRSATIVCGAPCKLLAIEQADFEAVLKSDLANQRDVRMQFMRQYLPGFRLLPKHKMTKVFYEFEHHTFSKGHVFVAQGICAEPQVCIVSDGILEIRHAVQPGESLGKQDDHLVSTMMPGSLFGSSHQQDVEPFSIVAATLCDVYILRGEPLKDLPLTVSHRIVEQLNQITKSRLQRCIATYPSRLQRSVSTSGLKTPSSPTLTRSGSFMTRHAAEKHRMRCSSGTHLSSLLSKADRNIFVPCGTLQMAHLSCEKKHEARPGSSKLREADVARRLRFKSTI